MIGYNFYVSTQKTFEIKVMDTDALTEHQEEYSSINHCELRQ